MSYYMTRLSSWQELCHEIGITRHEGGSYARKSPSPQRYARAVGNTRVNVIVASMPGTQVS